MAGPLGSSIQASLTENNRNCSTLVTLDAIYFFHAINFVVISSISLVMQVIDFSFIAVIIN